MNKPAAYRALIGPIHQDYYLSYFRRAEERGYAPMSWHWPVFFMGILWQLWRRQYRWALITLLVAFVSAMIGGLVMQNTGSEPAGQFVSSAIAFGYLLVYLPLHANAQYFDWCQLMIARTERMTPGGSAGRDLATDAEGKDSPQDKQRLELLTRLGGVNNNVPIALIVFLLVMAMLGGPPPELATTTGGN